MPTLEPSTKNSTEVAAQSTRTPTLLPRPKVVPKALKGTPSTPDTVRLLRKRMPRWAE